MKNRKIRKGSILMSFKLSIGKFGLAGTDMYCNEAIIYMNSKIQEVSQNYLYYTLQIVNWKQYGRGTIGENGNLNKDILSNIKIKIPKNKQLITDLEPVFKEIEELQSSIKEDEKSYKQYIQQLADEAIIKDKCETPQQPVNDTQSETASVADSTTSSNLSKMSLTDLKEQAKSLGIKGYSKLKKQELIEKINNFSKS